MSYQSFLRSVIIGNINSLPNKSDEELEILVKTQKVDIYFIFSNHNNTCVHPTQWQLLKFHLKFSMKLLLGYRLNILRH